MAGSDDVAFITKRWNKYTALEAGKVMNDKRYLMILMLIGIKNKNERIFTFWG